MAEKQIINNTGKFSESSSSSNVKSLNNVKVDSVTSAMSNKESTNYMTSSLQFLDKHKMTIIGVIVVGIIIYVAYGYYQENFNKSSGKNKKINKKQKKITDDEQYEEQDYENFEQDNEQYEEDQYDEQDGENQYEEQDNEEQYEEQNGEDQYDDDQYDENQYEDQEGDEYNDEEYDDQNNEEFDE